MITGLLAGNRRSLAQVISTIEDNGRQARAVLAELYPHGGRARIVGVTGAPGTGKSTLVNALTSAYRKLGMTVGIIAVDPTSPFSGGALLGDRVRMRDLAGDPGVFIRSMATRGSLGGLARTTADVIVALDAAGFERILVETVGVGQAEVDVASSAHTTIVVQAPGMGDEMQVIKAGVLEIADLFAVNKADREGADRVVMALQMMLGLGPSHGHHTPQQTQSVPVRNQTDGWQADGSWSPPIVRTVATTGDGIESLCDWIEVHLGSLQATRRDLERDTARATESLQHVLRELLWERLLTMLPASQFEQAVDAIARHQDDPYTAGARLVEVAWPDRRASDPTPSPSNRSRGR